MSRATWTTYAIRGYTHDVANDQASAGGAHLHQVRRTRSGHWQARIRQSNGRHSAAGEVRQISNEMGEAYWAAAKNN